MPLEAGAKEGTPGFGRNIATEIKAGKDPKQAEAIAYSKARGDKLDAIADAAEMLSHVVNRTHRTGGARTDALQPNPWANKIAALEGGIESVTARLARNTKTDAVDESRMRLRHQDLKIKRDNLDGQRRQAEADARKLERVSGKDAARPVWNVALQLSMAKSTAESEVRAFEQIMRAAGIRP